MFTNFPHGITSFGVPTMGMGGLPITGGTYFFVNSDTGSDGNDGLSMETPFKTVAKAYSKMTTNKYDVCVCMGSAEHTISAMLTISKNRCIFVGLDGAARKYGQRTRWSMGVTTDVLDVAEVINTGVGNVFINIKINNTNTLTQNVYGFAEGGEYTFFANVEFYKPTHLNSSTAAELLMNGDSSAFYNCTIGDLVNTTVSTAIRPCISLSREIVTGKVCRDGHFENCQILRKAAAVNARLVYSTGATDVERRLTFKDCLFVGAKLGANSPAEAIGGAASLTEGQIIVKDCMVVNITRLSALVGVWGNMPTADSDQTPTACQAS